MPRKHGAKTAPMEVRLAAIRMIKKGVSQNDVSDALGYNRVTIWSWQKAYRRKGEEGLHCKPMSGRPRKLSDAQLRKLPFLLGKGAVAYGFRGDMWTLKRIAFVIRKEFGVNYHPGHVWRVLLRLGFSRQKPERRAIERDDVLVERWKKRVWPQYRRQAARGGKTLIFLDETGRSETPTVVATWAPRGAPPLLRHIGHWDKCSVISGITPAGKLHYRLYLGSINSERVVTFLRHLLGRVPGQMLLFWDGGKIHRADIVKNFLHEHSNRLEVRPLPSYAPDLNPVEQLNRRLKHVETPNCCPASAPELLEETRAALERIRRRPDLVPSYFQHAGLPLMATMLIK